MFVIGISYKVNKNNKIKDLRVVLMALRLLEHAKKNKLIADGTFKLNWNGLHVALTGTVDMRYREKAKDYAFMFSTIVWNLELLFGYIYLSPIHYWLIMLAQSLMVL